MKQYRPWLVGASASLLALFGAGASAQSGQVAWQDANPQMREFLAGSWLERANDDPNDARSIRAGCEDSLIERQEWYGDAYYQSLFTRFPDLESAKGDLTFVSADGEMVEVSKQFLSTRFTKYRQVQVARGAGENEFILQFLEADEVWDDEGLAWNDDAESSGVPTFWFGVLQLGQRPDGSEVAIFAFPMSASGPFEATKTYIRCPVPE